MAGGRINEPRIRESAQPPVSVEASASTRAAASPPAASRQAARPAELSGLARPPASRAASGSTHGLSRHAALPVTQETAADPLDTFNHAERHISAWCRMAQYEREREARGAAHKGLNPDREVAYAGAAIESIRKCLDLLPTLRREHRFPPGYDTAAKETELLDLLAVAADTGICARNQTLNEIADQIAVYKAEHSNAAKAASTAFGPDDTRTDPPGTQDAADGMPPPPSAKAASSPLRALERESEKVQGWLGEFAGYRDALDDIMRRTQSPGMRTAPRIQLNVSLSDLIYDKLRCCKGMQTLNGILAAASANRLAALSKQVQLPELAARADELREAWHDHDEAMEAAVDALVGHGAENQPAQRLTQQALAGHQAAIEAYADGLDRVGLNLCLDAADGVEMEDADGVWRSMIDVVHALAAYKASLLELSETASHIKCKPGPMPEAPRPAPLPSVPTPAARPARSSGGAKLKNRKHGKRSGEPSVSAPPPAPVDGRTQAQKQADTLLETCPVNRGTVAQFGGDIVKIARQFGRDTSLIERELNDPKRDAVNAIDFVRGSAGNWFGERERVHNVKESLHPGDPRIEQLAERLGALALIEQRMKRLETDMLKRDMHPRSNHLTRLLEAGQIQCVEAPGRLPPEEGDDKVGTLFEIGIQFKPLSNQRKVAPWFVHVHTDQPVTAQALPTMAFKAFTAVHLKTAKERNRGPRWEAVMRALGYTDAKVHRAAIGPKLLSTLFVQAQKQPAASGAQASSRAANTMQKKSTAPSAPPPGHPRA
ncbi:type III secretion system effector XopP [Ralstonia solanacearum]|uniref:type III secretion system effector XopP n=1 Tax=Ralstonia solanacearum TaxID=305 RepID=UPI0005AC6FE8|nr:type III secretion system effector XopP [Ralstonia solanacearum]AMP72797.1 type III effector protein hlk1 [Ralstonia solanacearum]MCL9827519.1 type III effector protein hlk1 [Ralstonia solanacearum]MCL9833042.1 type III effector protein hlk1 [Ralstonia solanacearum]MCL9837823.1 type III effector protein hlk1 [Ralstonia solanacearum]OAI72514.1 type III effector protein hlk1 [Ralstonia solanacearum]